MIEYFDAFLTGCKLNTLTEESFKKITGLSQNDINFLVREKYYIKEKYYIDDEKIPCIQITKEGIDYAKKNYGYKKIYYSNSTYHDIKHSEIVADKLEELGATIRDYKSEKELPKIKGKTRVDGVIEIDNRRIGIETITQYYKQSQIDKKKEYCEIEEIEFNSFFI